MDSLTLVDVERGPPSPKDPRVSSAGLLGAQARRTAPAVSPTHSAKQAEQSTPEPTTNHNTPDPPTDRNTPSQTFEARTPEPPAWPSPSTLRPADQLYRTSAPPQGSRKRKRDNDSPGLVVANIDQLAGDLAAARVDMVTTRAEMSALRAETSAMRADISAAREEVASVRRLLERALRDRMEEE